jgi:hypothetical protein
MYVCIHLLHLAHLIIQELYYTLTTQLDKQRQHYEEKIARLESNAQNEIQEVLKRARSVSI